MSKSSSLSQNIQVMVNCPNCGILNSEGAKFCAECGTSLYKTCSNCKQKNSPQAKYCTECGTSLKSEGKPKTVSPIRPVEATPMRPAERRQLTVMFCDLVGSTALSEELDPEELRELIQKYQETCAEVVLKYEGHIAQYLGDGILVYFGYPIAHEDDAGRALRAALGIIQAIATLKLGCIANRCLQLSVRLGIHTGLVVVGEVGAGNKREELAIGQTPNLAARLQGFAQPSTAVVSPTTYRLVQGIFEFQSLGQHSLKGISTPVEIYQVLQEASSCKRQKVAESSWTPYVGREAELEQLQGIWERVKSGRGEVVLLMAEAGLGKSRLVQAFRERIANDTYTLREVFCSPYYQNTPFHPIIELIAERVLKLTREDSPEEQLDKLEQFLDSHQIPRQEAVPLFAQLLSLSVDQQDYPTLNLSPQATKQKLLEVMLAMIHKSASQQPLLVLVEDLHWIDPSTLELADRLIREETNYPILRIYTMRPGFQSHWLRLPHVTQINLNHLPANQIEQIIHGVTGGKRLPFAVSKLIVEKSDGIPLFIEEMTKMVIESGPFEETSDSYELTGPLPTLSIPDTLKGLLMERLDRLDGAKEVAQLGATIGREFSYELLRSLALYEEPSPTLTNGRQALPAIALDQASIIRGLEKLVETRLLFVNGELPKATYSFKNVLIQDAAYESLLRSTRAQYHRRIARVLEAEFPIVAGREPELLAYHYTKAGLPFSAINYWQKAGEKAFLASANEEAIAHLKSGLDLIDTLKAEQGRTISLLGGASSVDFLKQELDLQTTLGKALIATKGYASLEVEQIYKRSREICQELGTTPQLFSVFWGLWGYHAARCEHKIALDFGSRLMGLARRHNDPILEMEARFTLGFALFYLGRLQAAHEHWKTSYELYQKTNRTCQTRLTGQDVGVASLSYMSLSAWLLGQSEASVQYSEDAIHLALELSHPYSTGFALCMKAMFHQLRQEPEAVEQQAEAAIALASEQRFEFWLATGVIMQGWALVELGQTDLGINQLRRGIAAHAATGAKISWTYFLGLLAQAHAKAGQLEAGLAVLKEALSTVERTGERFWEAELFRLRGELMYTKGGGGQSLHPEQVAMLVAQSQASAPHSQSVEYYLNKAIEIAHAQGGKLLELRAAISLAQMWHQQGNLKLAQHLLARVYSQWPQGIESIDSTDVKLLLAIK
ncbi:adenylate/guanylate cyclase domain-containing protein [Limnoraphis robusta Tam1]|uniref:AAA family ATPase n=1 Tax=Limnoraphis robusta TaxID=1118279 RepID=UPI002B1EDF7B|nr:adenylate/guanylate cyclase domain-containing protein [Limnoraphis robusta]MEA5537468.1 adenylate/guanylate cyclase domain-containing protein [Limnoraphis robusta Tam1]